MKLYTYLKYKMDVEETGGPGAGDKETTVEQISWISIRGMVNDTRWMVI